MEETNNKNNEAAQEQARAYAIAALEEQIKMIEQAYLEGYKKGQQQPNPTTVVVDNVTYYDYGLPSGNLWSKPLLESGTYQRIGTCCYSKVKDRNLPTAEDFMELMRRSRLDYNENGLGHCTLNRITFADGRDYFKESASVFFALKDDPDDRNRVKAGRLWKGQAGIESIFVGDYCAVMYVKHPDEV